ncbi:MAG: hypothetical protein ABIJ18_05730 [archaeon]
MIQIYVALKDLIPNPKETFEWGMQNFPKLPSWFLDMQTNGFRNDKPLLVNWRGCIIDGNMRYHMAKMLNITHVPIDYNFLVRDLDCFIEIMGIKWANAIKSKSKEIKNITKELNKTEPFLSKTPLQETEKIAKGIIEKNINNEVK